MRWRYTEEGKKKLSVARKGVPKGKRTREHCMNISLALAGKQKSESHKKALSLSLMGRPMSCGGGHFIGRKHSESAKRKIALSKICVPRSKETRRKVSISLSLGILEGRIKITNTKRMRYRGISFRSNWEVLFAKVLDSYGIIWKYEEFLLIPSGGYLIDFYLPEYGFYVEIKGYWRDDALRKYSEAHLIYPIKLLMEKELKDLGVIGYCLSITKEEFIDRLGGELVRNEEKICA